MTTTIDRPASQSHSALAYETATQADPSDDLIYVYRPAGAGESDIAIRLRAALAAERWVGAGVVYGRRAGGLVTASVLGVTGVGPTAGAALLDLEHRLDGETF